MVLSLKSVSLYQLSPFEVGDISIMGRSLRSSLHNISVRLQVQRYPKNEALINSASNDMSERLSVQARLPSHYVIFAIQRKVYWQTRDGGLVPEVKL